MGAIEPRSNDGGDEELRSVGILSSVSHGKLERMFFLVTGENVRKVCTNQAGFGVLQLEVFIGEFLAINRFSTSAVSLIGLDQKQEAR